MNILTIREDEKSGLGLMSAGELSVLCAPTHNARVPKNPVMRSVSGSLCIGICDLLLMSCVCILNSGNEWQPPKAPSVKEIKNLENF